MIVRPTVGAPKRTCDLVIIGGGIMGLSVAYQCALRGLNDVVVIERGYLAEGASGRNGGGVRMQWSTESNIRLMRESIAMMRQFAGELGFNIWLRQGGYLFLAGSEAEHAKMAKNVALQNRCGVGTRILSPEEARSIVPELDVSSIYSAAYNPDDGVVFPWPFLWGYAQQAMARGVELHLRTPVTEITQGKKGFAVATPKGTIVCKRVLCAAGAWSPEVTKLVGVTLPTHPHRHEILSTEPLKPFLKPMVSMLSDGLYLSQSMRGEIVCGINVPDEDDGTVRMGSRLSFLTQLASAITRVIPRLARVKVLRQWAGPYDMSPDGNPIVGEPEQVPGFFLASGFMGHGFMMAPVIGRHYATWLTGGDKHELFSRATLERFTHGGLPREDMILG